MEGRRETIHDSHAWCKRVCVHACVCTRVCTHLRDASTLVDLQGQNYLDEIEIVDRSGTE